MKRLFSIFAVMLAFGLVGCDGDKKTDDGEKKEDKPVVAEITIDSDFSDWDNAPEGTIVSASINDRAFDVYNNDIVNVDITADEDYIYMHFFMDSANYGNLCCYVSSDDSVEGSTWGGYSKWADFDADYLLWGNYDGGYDLALYEYAGENGAIGWKKTIDAGTGLAEVSRMMAKPEGETVYIEFECAIDRTKVPFEDEISLGFILESEYGVCWGMLPFFLDEMEMEKDAALLVKLP